VSEVRRALTPASPTEVGEGLLLAASPAAAGEGLVAADQLPQ
jgi:hypothetical protein